MNFPDFPIAKEDGHPRSTTLFIVAALITIFALGSCVSHEFVDSSAAEFVNIGAGLECAVGSNHNNQVRDRNANPR